MMETEPSRDRHALSSSTTKKLPDSCGRELDVESERLQPFAQAGGGAGELYSLQSVLGRRRATARGTWTQSGVRHQLPVQLDNGLTAQKLRPTSIPTPLTPYRVSSVGVPAGMVNLTVPGGSFTATLRVSLSQALSHGLSDLAHPQAQLLDTRRREQGHIVKRALPINCRNYQLGERVYRWEQRLARKRRYRKMSEDEPIWGALRAARARRCGQFGGRKRHDPFDLPAAIVS